MPPAQQELRKQAQSRRVDHPVRQFTEKGDPETPDDLSRHGCIVGSGLSAQRAGACGAPGVPVRHRCRSCSGFTLCCQRTPLKADEAKTPAASTTGRLVPGAIVGCPPARCAPDRSHPKHRLNRRRPRAAPVGWSYEGMHPCLCPKPWPRGNAGPFRFGHRSEEGSKDNQCR
jgi:hypothetical protein